MEFEPVFISCKHPNDLTVNRFVPGNPADDGRQIVDDPVRRDRHSVAAHLLDGGGIFALVLSVPLFPPTGSQYASNGL